MNSVLIRSIEIVLCRRNGDFDFVLVLACRYHAEVGRNLVVALRTPGHIAAKIKSALVGEQTPITTHWTFANWEMWVSFDRSAELKATYRVDVEHVHV
jgi:hypothetical protein